MTDIYDGKLWKTFKDDDSTIFFQGEVADSHLGLMLNLDWFQPYDGTMHSTGAIYAAICNLPRDIQFRRENLLLPLVEIRPLGQNSTRPNIGRMVI